MPGGNLQLYRMMQCRYDDQRVDSVDEQIALTAPRHVGRSSEDQQVLSKGPQWTVVTWVSSSAVR